MKKHWRNKVLLLKSPKHTFVRTARFLFLFTKPVGLNYVRSILYMCILQSCWHCSLTSCGHFSRTQLSPLLRIIILSSKDFWHGAPGRQSQAVRAFKTFARCIIRVHVWWSFIIIIQYTPRNDDIRTSVKYTAQSVILRYYFHKVHHKSVPRRIVPLYYDKIRLGFFYYFFSKSIFR